MWPERGGRPSINHIDTFGSSIWTLIRASRINDDETVRFRGEFEVEGSPQARGEAQCHHTSRYLPDMRKFSRLTK